MTFKNFRFILTPYILKIAVKKADSIDFKAIILYNNTIYIIMGKVSYKLILKMTFTVNTVWILRCGKVKKYVTDFPNPVITGVKNAIVIPHLGASTEESEDNCAKMAVKEVMEFLENGNIRNSVNYPNCEMGLRGEHTRITIMHRNVPNMIGQFSAI